MRSDWPIALTAGLAVALTLGGCGSDPAARRQVFAFTLPADPPVSAPKTNVVALGRVTISSLFQSRAFTYRTAENKYVQDPYAGFLTAPERALAESIRAGLRQGGAIGRVIEPGSGLTPSMTVEAAVTELYGDFRDLTAPAAAMEIHFIIYEVELGEPGRIVLDKVCSRRTPLARRTPEALVSGWDADLSGILSEINSEYIKEHADDRR